MEGGKPEAFNVEQTPMNIPCSVVVLTKNEERNIRKCLKSVASFGEVFVVDSSSTDATCKIATEMGAIITQFHWNGRYPKKKGWCLENLPFSNRWVLYVDADEELTPAGAAEIAHVVEAELHEPRHAAFFVGYDYVFLDRVLKHGFRTYKLVLVDHDRAHFLEYDDLGPGSIGEVEGHCQPAVDGKVGVLRQRMLHRDHDSLYHYFERHNRYSDWEAARRRKGLVGLRDEADYGMRKGMKQLFAVLPFKGTLAFIDSYFLRLGLLDGAAGFHYAVARGNYYWQVGAKLRELKTRSAVANLNGSSAPAAASLDAKKSSVAPVELNEFRT
jgi:glycosyltransferase involved in cell wall biosynthesis